ncbi:hypothetical protein [Lysobacter gummosus]|uniref:hypothetical protein n=1 Tax=Lysobacter gummosus TaxID=262324 RepID=UPI003643EDB3
MSDGTPTPPVRRAESAQKDGRDEGWNPREACVPAPISPRTPPQKLCRAAYLTVAKNPV